MTGLDITCGWIARVALLRWPQPICRHKVHPTHDQNFEVYSGLRRWSELVLFRHNFLALAALAGDEEEAAAANLIERSNFSEQSESEWRPAAKRHRCLRLVIASSGGTKLRYDYELIRQIYIAICR